MDCCKPKDDNEIEGHHNDKEMEGHRGGCCGGYKMWIVMGVIFVAIWYFQNRN